MRENSHHALRLKCPATQRREGSGGPIAIAQLRERLNLVNYVPGHPSKSASSVTSPLGNNATLVVQPLPEVAQNCLKRLIDRTTPRLSNLPPLRGRRQPTTQLPIKRPKRLIDRTTPRLSNLPPLRGRR